MRATTIGEGGEGGAGGAGTGGRRDVAERAADLARRYARLIRSAVARVGGAEAARIGDDVEQRVLIQLFRQLAGEQVIHHPASYLYRAAVRETVRVLRGELRVEKSREAAAELPRAEPSPERRLASRELREQMAAALATLTADRRRAVRAHLAGFEVAEIMAMNGWTYNRARNLVARGMADLRRALRARGVGVGDG
jgi:RNA polymerase sigma factor (sigma-70 family)